MDESVLVIGSGGREHCIAWKLSQSSSVKSVYVCPGNGGTLLASNMHNVDIDIKNFESLSKWCKAKEISLVVVGPEDPLANGIVDALAKDGILCFGPTSRAAQIEASKEFAKGFMDKHDIPTARWKSFTDADQAQTFIKNAEFDARVIKASGLAAGKGVVVCKDKEEACNVVKEMLNENKLGSAGHVVVVEELLDGEEVSCLALSDGEDVICFPPAQDHKRLLEGNKGPNTGGMGAYCPCPLVSPEELVFIQKKVIKKTVDGMKEDGMPFAGVLYAGMMLTKDGPKVLEFNCRFGDPETQVLLPLLKSDLYPLLKACVEGNLKANDASFESGMHTVAVVLASEGYPGKYPKGLIITGTEKVEEELKLNVFHAGTRSTEGNLLTNGGRVLAIVAKDADLATAAWKAQLGASRIKFEGKVYRQDIAHHALQNQVAGLTYSDSGVSIEAGDAFVNAIKPAVKGTHRAGCCEELGGFGGVFDLRKTNYKDPLLISGTDGVGTKLKVAHQMGIHSTIGQDLVAMCVNDVLCHGAEPLYFLDYFACGKLDVSVAKEVVNGISEGCKLSGCALMGGETAEMPGMYSAGEYDLAGFCVGAVERVNYLPNLDEVSSEDVVIGVASSGLHSNGFSLVRRIIEHCQFTFDMLCPWDDNQDLGTALLTPTKIYVKSVLPLLQNKLVKAVAHITGGGLPGNIIRVLPNAMGVQLDAKEWKIHPVFSWVAEKGNVSAKEMARTFNLGIGLVLVVSKENQAQVLEQLKEAGETASVIGKLCSQDSGERVIIQNLDKALCHVHHKHSADGKDNFVIDKKARVAGTDSKKKKVGILISGTGTNLQALIDYTRDESKDSSAEIALVISNKPDVQGLKRAQAAGIPIQVINNKEFDTREDFDTAVSKSLRNADVEIVCLAGFMRILSGTFVKEWRGKLLNVHPSLLPSFKGMNAHKQVLESGVRVTGCSVHFVVEEVDAGAILVQETVPVLPEDTEELLSERVKAVEHIAFPKALELLASNKAKLDDGGKIKWSL